MWGGRVVISGDWPVLKETSSLQFRDLVPVHFLAFVNRFARHNCREGAFRSAEGRVFNLAGPGAFDELVDGFFGDISLGDDLLRRPAFGIVPEFVAFARGVNSSVLADERLRNVRETALRELVGAVAEDNAVIEVECRGEGGHNVSDIFS